MPAGDGGESTGAAGAAREGESPRRVQLVLRGKTDVAVGGEQTSRQTFQRGSGAVRGSAGRGEGTCCCSQG